MPLYLKNGSLLKISSSLATNVNCCCNTCPNCDCPQAPATLSLTTPVLTVCAPDNTCGDASQLEVGSTSITLYKCLTCTTISGTQYRDWLYRSEPIEVGTLEKPCSLGGPCEASSVYLIAEVGQRCVFTPGASPPLDPSSTNWYLTIQLVTSWDGCTGCTLTPADISTTPCINWSLPFDTTNDYEGTPFTWTVSSGCPSVWNGISPPGSWSGGPYSVPLCSDPTLLGIIVAYHEDWIYQDPPIFTCDPTGDYFYLDGDSNLQSVNVG